MELVSLLLIALVLFFVYQTFAPIPGVREIKSGEDLKNVLKDKNVQLIDVRTPAEYRANHIKGFKNMPLQILQNKIHELSREKETIVICQSGMRSRKACRLLKKSGFKQIANVKGGMNSWRG